ncbi:MAG: emrB, partial [Rhodoferax sp.]|nr:emrB [Rhodoferax sp.]
MSTSLTAPDGPAAPPAPAPAPAAPAAAPAAHPPLEGSARIWGTIALAAATFMNVLDTSIAN